MWIDRLVSSRLRNAIELSARVTEERHKVRAENVANIDTPDYHAKSLDEKPFQAALGEAVHDARRANSSTLKLRTAQVSNERGGALNVKPAVEPAPNALFHDGTNARLESLMTDVQQNAMSHSLAMNLLKSQFESLQMAIRGKNV